MLKQQVITSNNQSGENPTKFGGVYFLIFACDAGEQSIHKVILIK